MVEKSYPQPVLQGPLAGEIMPESSCNGLLRVHQRYLLKKMPALFSGRHFLSVPLLRSECRGRECCNAPSQAADGSQKWHS
jgi:hypothetical protein